MAGQRSMALIGRIGTTGASFLVGAGTTFTATTTGVLYLAPNTVTMVNPSPGGGRRLA